MTNRRVQCNQIWNPMPRAKNSYPTGNTMMTSAMASSAQLPLAGPNGLGLAPNSEFRLMRLLWCFRTCRKHSWMPRQSRTPKISVFPENLNKLKIFQVTCPNQLGMLRNFRTRLIRILWDVRTYRDHQKNSQNARAPKMQLSPRKMLRTTETQLRAQKHNGTSSNSRIRIIAPLWH